jgi:pyruvate/2-oxoglutarate dehydrogenase complex dihydrolipoamide dehydrogenase (E3) component
MATIRPAVPSIYAIGDVTDRINLTPVALAEGMALAWHLYRDHERPVDYEFVPSAVFSHPNLGNGRLYRGAGAREVRRGDGVQIHFHADSSTRCPAPRKRPS